MRNPIVHIPRPLKPENWKAFLKGVPGVDPEVLHYVFPGPDMEFKRELAPMDTSKFRIFEMGEAVIVLKALVDHWILKRFAGPFPSSVTHINGEKLDFNPMFCVPKEGDSPAFPKKRVIFNAAATHPIPYTRKQMDQVMKHDFENDPRFEDFREGLLVRTLNDNLVKQDVEFTRIKDIVQGLYRSKLLWKLDLSRGFRHIIRMRKSWRFTAMFLRIRHPITGAIIEFVTIDCTAAMGISNSPSWFEKTCQAFTKACIFHRPDLFVSKENSILLFSYMDDYLGGAGFFQKKLSDAIDHALHQTAYIMAMGNWLGLTFKREKMKSAESHQALLGVTLDLLQRNLALKPGKAVSVADFTDNLLSHLFWDKKAMQSLCGNTVWLSCLLPRIRSYMTPFIQITKLIKDKNGSLAKGVYPALDQEATRCLKFVRAVFMVDPSVHIYKYLNLLPIHKTPLWSDASGYEIDSKNPTPGRLSSIFLYKFAPNKKSICAYSDWKDILPILRSKIPNIDSVPWFESVSCTRLDPRKDDLSIAYLELSALFLTLIQLVLLCSRSPNIFKRCARKQLIFKCDNQNVVTWITNGRIGYFPWNRLLDALFIFEMVLECRILVEWVPSELQLADPLSRGCKHVVYENRRYKARKHEKATIDCFVNLLLHGPNMDVLQLSSKLRAKRCFEEPLPVLPLQSTLTNAPGYGRESPPNWTRCLEHCLISCGLFSCTSLKKEKRKDHGKRTLILTLSWEMPLPPSYTQLSNCTSLLYSL